MLDLKSYLKVLKEPSKIYLIQLLHEYFLYLFLSFQNLNQLSKILMEFEQVKVMLLTNEIILK